MKGNFLLKNEYIEIFNELSDEDAGKLIKGILNYTNTKDSQLDGLLKAVFIPIKNDIDKNEENYQKKCEKNRENGSLGGRPKKTEENRTVIEETENNPTITEENPKKHDNNHNSYITYHNSNIIKEIINYLNTKTNSNYKFSSKSNQSKINARLNEGYSLDDFIAVIDKKTAEWLGTEWEKYLCPETLFGTKFEKYLNQKAQNKIPNWFNQNLQTEKRELTEDEQRLYEEIVGSNKVS